MTRRRQFWTCTVASVLLNFGASLLFDASMLTTLAVLVLANVSGMALRTAGERP